MGRLPEIAELRTFLLAADEQSLSRAAQRLHLSPAAVAKRLDNLEAVLGYPLLQRGPRGVRLTPTGRAFRARAQRIVESAEGLLDRADAAAAERLSGVHDLLGRRTAPSTELLLADVERLLGHLLDSVASGVVLHHVSDGTIIEANDAYCRLAGSPRERIIGSIPPWYTDPTYESLLASLEGGDAVRMTTLAQTPSRRGGAAELAARRIAIAGRDVLLVVIDDVTRTRETQRRLADRIRRQALVSRLAAMIPLELEDVLAAVLEAARTELGLDAAGLFDHADGDGLDAVVVLGDDGAGLIAAAERHERRWARDEVVAEFEPKTSAGEVNRTYVICSPLPGRRTPSHVLAARGARAHRVDADELDFIRSITLLCAVALTAAGEFAA